MKAFIVASQVWVEDGYGRGHVGHVGDIELRLLYAESIEDLLRNKLTELKLGNCSDPVAWLDDQNGNTDAGVDQYTICELVPGTRGDDELDQLIPIVHPEEERED